MSDEEFGTEPEVETQETGPETTSQDEAPSGGNPAWQPYREALPEINFKLIEPLLAEQDKQVNRKFEEIHKQYEPLKPYQELGVPAERIQQVMPIMDMLDADPVQFYELLIQHPAVAAKLAEATGQDFGLDEPAEQPDPTDISSNPQFQQMQEQLSGFQKMFEEQQRQEATKQVDAEVESEVAAFRQGRPDLTDGDMENIFNRISATYQNTGKLLSFEQAAGAHDAYRNSILSAPRPGASAPRVMPTNGGAPSPNSPAKLGTMSPQQTRDLMASLVNNLNEQG